MACTPPADSVMLQCCGGSQPCGILRLFAASALWENGWLASQITREGVIAECNRMIGELVQQVNALDLFQDATDVPWTGRYEHKSSAFPNSFESHASGHVDVGGAGYSAAVSVVTTGVRWVHPVGPPPQQCSITQFILERISPPEPTLTTIEGCARLGEPSQVQIPAPSLTVLNRLPKEEWKESRVISWSWGESAIAWALFGAFCDPTRPLSGPLHPCCG